ncbi:MAG: hypothetical protein ACI93T_002615 [Porticoccaceae bacterium]|jgi:hypothetical protein
MRRTAKKTGLLITTAAAGLATLSQCNAGLLSDFFDKHADKDRDAIEKRLPACDCSFGYFKTAWQPWGTCDQNSGTGCSSGNCSNSAPTILRGFQPGYSTGPSPNAMPSYGDSWNSHDNVLPPTTPHTFNGVPNSSEGSPSPILMRPLQPEPASELPPSAASPPTTFQPRAVNPFPRAIKTNPELPSLSPNPYSNPTPTPGSPLPTAPQPQVNPGFSVPLDSPHPTPGLPDPATTIRQPLPQPTRNYGSSGTGITLPPRRATSVTIDIPPGSAGTTLSLPDPVQSGGGGGFGGAAGSPRPDAPGIPSLPVPNSVPSTTPGDTGLPLTPEPSLRRQPPLPMPSVVPGPASTYRMPHPQSIPQFPAVQHANTQQVQRQYSTAPMQQLPPQQIQRQQFQPATHWQAVPQQQPQQRTGWRVIPGTYPQPSIQQRVIPHQPQRRMPTPSERVIYLPPPPRR